MEHLSSINMYGIDYTKPKVILLQESGIGVAEIAARTCYDSFDNSENECIKNFNPSNVGYISELEEIESSKLLESLAWVHHHHSIIEHATLSFLVQGTSRGVLQEHARHRLQSISVRSTRYTMSSVINAYLASSTLYVTMDVVVAKLAFKQLIKSLDMFIFTDENMLEIESNTIYDKLEYQLSSKDVTYKDMLSKEGQNILLRWKYFGDNLFSELEKAKKKRNVGDAFKHIVTDNWKVDMVITFNIRSLKNYFDLRDSGAAYFQIQWLAQAIKEATPNKYLKLIDKKYK